MRRRKEPPAALSRKLNCWEYMKCGREPKGEKVEELGVCPVAIHPYADGINEGINGGRICWAIVGSYSVYHREGKGPCWQKPPHYCFECEFHKSVLKDGGIIEPDFLGVKKGTRKSKTSKRSKP